MKRVPIVVYEFTTRGGVTVEASIRNFVLGILKVQTFGGRQIWLAAVTPVQALLLSGRPGVITPLPICQATRRPFRSTEKFCLLPGKLPRPAMILMAGNESGFP